MRITLVIPVFNQILNTFGQWGTLLYAAGNWNNIELIVVDNGSTDRTEELLKRFVLHLIPRTKYIKLPTNQGFAGGFNRGLEQASGDVVAVMHNDLYVYEYSWCETLCKIFDQTPDLGIAGFVGAKHAMADGGRGYTISNLVDAEQHGTRIAGTHPVVVLDSLFMAARREFWAETNGLDEAYGPNHWTDKDSSMYAISTGRRNLCVGVACYHPGSVTASSEEYRQQGDDHQIYTAGHARYLQKWGHLLPRQA